jgi:ATP-binding cassette subfamily F protein uup
VATTVVALEGDGRWGLYAEYSQWEQERAERKAPSAPKKDAPPAEANMPAPVAKKKLSYLEQREWDGMEALILTAEEEWESAKAALDDPSVFSDHTKVQAATERAEAAHQRVETLYQRWAELEAKVG